MTPRLYDGTARSGTAGSPIRGLRTSQNLHSETRQETVVSHCLLSGSVLLGPGAEWSAPRPYRRSALPASREYSRMKL